MMDARPKLPEVTVSELSLALRQQVEEAFGEVRVRGEIGRVSCPSSGHVYLDLKDEKAVLNGVVWKGTRTRLQTQPEQGLEVICTGKLTTFPGQSRYQIIIEHMEPAGAGALMALLDERKRKLAAEGLFEAGRKKALPGLPGVIGVVTSPTGAVIKDILHRLHDRFPCHVLVWPVRVQGENSAAEVTAAIEGFNASDPVMFVRPDLLIVARGGGSLEDLWSFNEENVVRAAAASTIPLISAVGHETDTTLIDLAADRRAPTPTAAAEMAVPVRSELLAQISENGSRLVRSQIRALELGRSRLAGLVRGLPGEQELFALHRQRADHAGERLGRGLEVAVYGKRNRFMQTGSGLIPQLAQHRLRQAGQRLGEQGSGLGRAFLHYSANISRRLGELSRMLGLLSYKNVLERGFAVVWNSRGQPVKNSAGLRSGAGLELEFADNDRLCVTVDREASSKPSGPVRTSRKRKRGLLPDKQGRLL